MNDSEIKNITSYRFFNKLIALPFVEKIYLYGSRAKGFNDERADIDLAIECPNASDGDWNQVLEIIEKADTLLGIDYVRFDKIKSEKFKKAILQNHHLLFNR